MWENGPERQKRNNGKIEEAPGTGAEQEQRPLLQRPDSQPRACRTPPRTPCSLGAYVATQVRDGGDGGCQGRFCWDITFGMRSHARARR